MQIRLRWPEDAERARRSFIRPTPFPSVFPFRRIRQSLPTILTRSAPRYGVPPYARDRCRAA